MKYRRVIFGEPDREQTLRIISRGIEERYEVMIEKIGIDQEIAKKTGREVKEVAKGLQKLAEQAAAKPEELGWVCMYCGNGNPERPYKGRPDREDFNALKENQ